MNKFVIPGRLTGLNESIRIQRTNKYKANNLKKSEQSMIIAYIRKSKLKPVKNAVKIKVDWYEPNNRRDIDNITFGIKQIMDSLVLAGVLYDDSRKYVIGIENNVFTDKDNPRIEVELIERIENE